MGGRPGGWVAGSIETKAISALKLELKLELAGAELGKKLHTFSKLNTTKTHKFGIMTKRKFKTYKFFLSA